MRLVHRFAFDAFGKPAGVGQALHGAAVFERDLVGVVNGHPHAVVGVPRVVEGQALRRRVAGECRHLGAVGFRSDPVMLTGVDDHLALAADFDAATDLDVTAIVGH